MNKRRSSKVLRSVVKRKNFWWYRIEVILLSDVEEEIENESIEMKKVENVQKEPGGRVKVSLNWTLLKVIIVKLSHKGSLTVWSTFFKPRRIGKYGPDAKKTIKKIEIGSCLPKLMVRFEKNMKPFNSTSDMTIILSLHLTLIVTSVSTFLAKSFGYQYQILIIIQKLYLAMKRRGQTFGLNTNRYKKTKLNWVKWYFWSGLRRTVT